MPKSKYNLNESKANREMHVLCTEKNNCCSIVNELEQSDIWIRGKLAECKPLDLVYLLERVPYVEMWKSKLDRFSDNC